MAFVTQRPLLIEDGPFIDNSAMNGEVSIFNPDDECRVCLTKDDIEFILDDLANFMYAVKEEIIGRPNEFWLTDDATIEAARTDKWCPPKVYIRLPETSVGCSIELFFIRGAEELTPKPILLKTVAAGQYLRWLLSQMKHDPRPQNNDQIEERSDHAQSPVNAESLDESPDRLFNEIQSFLSKENGAE